MALDAKTELHLDYLYPSFAASVREALEAAQAATGRLIRITESVRPFSRQAVLFEQGRTTPGKRVTNAKAGLSIHHYGVACDCAFGGEDPYLDNASEPERNRAWDLFGQAVEHAGLTWGGGNWGGPSDRPHCEETWGLTVGHLKSIFDKHGLSGVWEAFDLAQDLTPGELWRGRALYDPSK